MVALAPQTHAGLFPNFTSTRQIHRAHWRGIGNLSRSQEHLIDHLPGPHLIAPLHVLGYDLALSVGVLGVVNELAAGTDSSAIGGDR